MSILSLNLHSSYGWGNVRKTWTFPHPVVSTSIYNIINLTLLDDKRFILATNSERSRCSSILPQRNYYMPWLDHQADKMNFFIQSEIISVLFWSFIRTNTNAKTTLVRVCTYRNKSPRVHNIKMLTLFVKGLYIMKFSKLLQFKTNTTILHSKL